MIAPESGDRIAPASGDMISPASGDMISPASGDMISLQHVTKLYGTVIGANDLHLNLPRGAYALLGPNGSGKTTLINMLTGQVKPTMGSVRVFGEKTWRNRRILSRIGLCPAVDVLYPNVTARQWVRHLAALSLLPPDQVDDAVDAALKQVRLNEAADRLMGTYSLGMRQRAKLAQAIVHQPDLLILDEPFNGLDPIGRGDVIDLLRQWVDQGRGLLLASHVLHEVEAVTDAFLLIFGGRLMAAGDREEIESIVVGGPQRIEVRGKHLDRLIGPLAATIQWRELRWQPDSDDTTVGTLTAFVSQSDAFLHGLVRHNGDQGVRVDSVRGVGGQLETLFDSLMRTQRGQRA
ncbi:MAG: ABC transporter ATP-binding protein [Planctomycetota bacterium]